tara:strand:- start:281 stop:1207 length:927 start_codon:yes stop_codon:yes gene_type:complete
MQVLLVILGLVIGLILLVRGADEMVKCAIHIAQKYKIPQSIVGAVYIGFGTSAPEWVASTTAVLQGDLPLAIGNIIGSNIANSLLVLSILFLLIGQGISKNLNLNLTSSNWMLIVTAIFIAGYLILDNFSRLLGMILLVAIFFAIRSMIAKGDSSKDSSIEQVKIKNLALRSVLSIAATIYGSKLVVDSAIDLATIFNISSLVIGVVVVAFGTSLPEIVSTISAAKFDKPEIVFGNIFGSNLFNIGLVGGTSILIAPGKLNSEITIQLLAMAAASVFVVYISRQEIKKSYAMGIILFLLYLIFILSLF